MSLRAPDPSPPSSGPAHIVAAPCVDTVTPTSSSSPVLDRQETNRIEPGSVTVSSLTPGGSYAGVGGPPAGLGSDPHGPQQPSPFSRRKVVPASPLHSVAREGDVAAGHPAPSSSSTAPALSAGAEVDSGSPSIWRNHIDRRTADDDQQRIAVDHDARRCRRRNEPDGSCRTRSPRRPGGIRAIRHRADRPALGHSADLGGSATPSCSAIRFDRDHLKTGQTLSIILGLACARSALRRPTRSFLSVFGERTAVLVRLMTPACFINSVNTVQYAILVPPTRFSPLEPTRYDDFGGRPRR